MKKRGQVWVETVVYTLVALVLIGLVLTFVKPKITELQDKVIIQQTISVMNSINNKLVELSDSGPGNKRNLELTIKSGSMTINGTSDQIVFDMDSHYQFSEPNEPVNYGDIVIYDTVFSGLNRIKLTLNYTSKYNVTYLGGDTSKTLTASSTPYTLLISNKGGTNPNMDFEMG